MTVDLPIDRPDGDGEVHLTITVSLGDGTPWAPAGHVVAVAQLPLDRTEPTADPVAMTAERAARPAFTVDDDGLLTGTLLAASPVLSLWRAPTDNDPEPARAWRRWGLDRLSRTLVAVDRHGATTEIHSEQRTGDGTVITHVQRVTTSTDGAVTVDEEVTIPDGFHDLPRVGTSFELSPGLDTIEWFGRGPHETYPDRRRAGWIGRHSLPVDATAFPYISPQETGGRADVRWFTVVGGDGHGVRIDLDRPRQVSVTRHRAADLTCATHHEELVQRPEAIVHIDAAHRGLGTASCGPDTLPRYLVRPGVHRWVWSIRTI